MSAARLVAEVEELIMCTNSTQIQVEDLIAAVEALIGQAQNDIAQVLFIS